MKFDEKKDRMSCTPEERIKSALYSFVMSPEKRHDLLEYKHINYTDAKKSA